MTVKPLLPEPTFRRAALDASNVGTWEIDVENDRFRCDAAAAAIYRLTPAEGVVGVPIGRTADVIYPDDLRMWRARRALSLRQGGVFVIEYRILSPGGEVRWVLVRGRYDVGPSGRVVEGRGVVVDVTDSKRDGFVEGQASMIDPIDPGCEDALERAAVHALAAHRALSEPGGDTGPAALAAAGRLLEEVGLAIARRRSRLKAPPVRH